MSITRTSTDEVDLLFRAAWALSGSPLVAEDLVEATVGGLNRRVRGARRRRGLEALLRQLLKTNARRRFDREAQPAAVSKPTVRPQVVTERPARASAEPHAVMAAIAAVPEREREALIAVDLVGLSYGQAASTLDATVETIASLLFRARAHLARTLADVTTDGRGMIA